jgi:hypothetical protein
VPDSLQLAGLLASSPYKCMDVHGKCMGRDMLLQCRSTCQTLASKSRSKLTQL